MQVALATQIQTKHSSSSYVTQQTNAMPQVQQKTAYSPQVNTLAQTKVGQGSSCQQSLTSIFQTVQDPVEQFAKWMTFCKDLDLRIPSKLIY
jgi:succinate dehydrogenase/fumarate reductase flavoprotein subunit